MIIGISGKYGTGKTTLANALQQEFGGVHLAFATRLKQAASIITGVAEEHMWTDEGKSIYIQHLGMTVGRFLQVFGTKMRETFGYDIWVDPVIGETERHDLAFIADCRFPNEVEAIKAAGGVVIRLNRPNVDPALNGRDPNHPSETALDDYKGFDLVIENDGTLEQMLAAGEAFVRSKINNK